MFVCDMLGFLQRALDASYVFKVILHVVKLANGN
jgi:hypothetical protein